MYPKTLYEHTSVENKHIYYGFAGKNGYDYSATLFGRWYKSNEYAPNLCFGSHLCLRKTCDLTYQNHLPTLNVPQNTLLF